jgi:hypothetical protein
MQRGAASRIRCSWFAWRSHASSAADEPFLVQTFRRSPGLPINQLWQSVRNRVSPGAAKDAYLQVPSRSRSSPGGYARSGRRSRRPLSIAPRARRLSSDQVGRPSRRSKARDSARRSVTCFCSERARVRITGRSLRVEDEPAPASALLAGPVQRIRRGRAFRPFRSNSIIAAEPRGNSTRGSKAVSVRRRSSRSRSRRSKRVPENARVRLRARGQSA